MKVELFKIIGFIYLFLFFFSIIASIIILKKRNNKKYYEILNELEKNKNLILSGDILVELKKVKALINNKELERTYKLWEDRYKLIKEEDVPNLNDRLILLDELVSSKKYKGISKIIANLEIDIHYIKTKSDFLLNEIKEISLSETKNREIVTKLKADYREIFLKYNNDSSEYEIIKKPIELQFENIDKLFASFETSMEKNDYNEVSKIVKALDDLIGNLRVVVNDAPSIILKGKNIIPVKIADVRTISKKMIEETYNLDYLNIDYNIGESEKKIKEIFDKLNVLNVTNASLELDTILNYFESLHEDFEKEKEAKIVFEDNMRKVFIKSKKMMNIVEKILSKIEEIKYSYDLSNNEVKVVDELNINIKTILSDYEELKENYRKRLFAFSMLNKELNTLRKRLGENETRLNDTLRHLGSLKEDEIRAKEQVIEIENILKDSKDKIRIYKLPVIPSNYNVYYKEALEALNNLKKELSKTPISIKVLNTRVDTARDLSLKLYQECNETMKTARLAENAIVYGNKYKPINTHLYKGLKLAERKFYNGKYKDALEQAINSISLVDKEIYDKLVHASKGK